MHKALIVKELRESAGIVALAGLVPHGNASALLRAAALPSACAWPLAEQRVDGPRGRRARGRRYPRSWQPQ